MGSPNSIKRLQSALDIGGLEVPRGSAERGIGYGAQEKTRKKFVQDPDGRQRVIDESYYDTEVRGVDPKIATQQADTFRAMFDKAATESQKPKVGDSAYDDLADVIQSYQREHSAEIADNNATIIAPMVDALMNLDANTRKMVLGKAGNPEIFKNLLDAELEVTSTASREAGVSSARKDVDAEAKEKAAGQKELPMLFKVSSQFGKPDAKNTRGEIVPGSHGYKNDRVLDDPTVNMDIKDMAPSTRMKTLQRLAGDQLQEKFAIETAKDKQGEYLRDKDGNPVPSGRTATLPDVVGNSRSPDALKKGTGDEVVGGQRVDPDIAVQQRNRDRKDQILEQMYMATQPQARRNKGGNLITGLQDAAKSGSASNPSNLARADAPSDTTIDLDKLFPWWRARFGELDSDGNLAYPARMTSPEFVTGMIMSLYNVPGELRGDFMSRMLPLIQRSIDAAPDVPEVSMMLDKATGKEIPTPKSAHYYAQTVQLPSKSFMRVMEKGVGTPDYPHRIYGDREIDVPEVQAPERHPFEGRKASPEDGASIRRGGVGLPANSPMRLLMA